MKAYQLVLKYKSLLVLLGTLSVLGLSGCAESGFSANSGGGGSSVLPPPTTPTTGACGEYTQLSNALEGEKWHIFQGDFRFDKNSAAQQRYRRFMGDFGKFCANNANGEYRINPRTGQYELFYGYYQGIANCSDWDDISKVWIFFPKGQPTRAHVVVDSTMSGYPAGWQGQGYDTQRMQLTNAQINCNVTDKTEILYEPVAGYQFKIVIYKGNKSTEHIRAELFYQGASMGKNDMFIVPK
ncbi:MAG: hypothetical protein M9899_11065 [Bdellovibrionaceae bacterium]|nr:hypothetical protein [Pseudobdellovibrionaceae bacterium]